MQARLYAELVGAIQHWADEACEGNAWAEFYAADTLVELMARAGACVYDAMEDGQKYAVAEGLLEEPKT